MKLERGDMYYLTAIIFTLLSPILPFMAIAALVCVMLGMRERSKEMDG